MSHVNTFVFIKFLFVLVEIFSHEQLILSSHCHCEFREWVYLLCVVSPVRLNSKFVHTQNFHISISTWPAANNRSSFKELAILFEMIYGILLDSARDSIVQTYGTHCWKRIVNELKLPTDTFDPFMMYSDKILMEICECKSNRSCLFFCCIVKTFSKIRYRRYSSRRNCRHVLRIFRSKYSSILHQTWLSWTFSSCWKKFKRIFLCYRSNSWFDALQFSWHDSSIISCHWRRWKWNDFGIQVCCYWMMNFNSVFILLFRSKRLGLMYFAIGSLIGAAKYLFNQCEIRVELRHDYSTNECEFIFKNKSFNQILLLLDAHIIIWMEFDNRTYQSKPIIHYPNLPNLNGTTFFKVCHFIEIFRSTRNQRLKSLGISILNLDGFDTSNPTDGQ